MVDKSNYIIILRKSDDVTFRKEVANFISLSLDLVIIKANELVLNVNEYLEIIEVEIKHTIKKVIKYKIPTCDEYTLIDVNGKVYCTIKLKPNVIMDDGDDFNKSSKLKPLEKVIVLSDGYLPIILEVSYITLSRYEQFKKDIVFTNTGYNANKRFVNLKGITSAVFGIAGGANSEYRCSYDKVRQIIDLPKP